MVNLKPGNRGQAGGGNLVSLFIGVMIALVVAVQVVIPVINDAIASSNVTGTTATILGLVSTFIALLVLLAVVSPLMRRF